MYDDYRDNGFVPVAVNLNESMDIVKGYARQYTNPYLRDNLTVWGMYRQTGRIPLNYVIDPEGIIRYIAEGFDETTMRQVIMQYLPGPIEHDVGVANVISPSGTVDSGDVIVPACSVRNYGPDPETYQVRVKIGTLFDTVAMVNDHQPGQSRYVEFPAWTALERSRIAVTCSTELATDDIPNNDKATGSVQVHVYDLAVTAIIAPGDTADSAVAVVPMAEVRNLGTVADMARVRFVIGDFYLDSVRVPLQPGVTDTAEFPPWTPEQLGTFAMSCSVGGRWDMILDNNLTTGTVHVAYRAAVEESPEDVPGLSAFAIRPNPAGRTATIQYSLGHAGGVEVGIYSVNGELIRTVSQGQMPAGNHTVAWNGRDNEGRLVGRGIYYCRLTTDEHRVSQKLVKTE